MNKALKLENQLCFRLYAASRNMTRVYQPHLEKYGLTYPQYIMMLILFEYETIDFKELSKIIDLKTGTLTPIVNKVQELGYVVKVKNELDARRLNIALTKKGKALRDEIVKVPYELANSLGLSEDEYSKLTVQLDELIEKLQKVQEL